ncbi:MAG: hypothetical protein K2K12_02140, partial [Clostridia bacterium]|nr:hypothetical protein [Clostridia bacterium]
MKRIRKYSIILLALTAMVCSIVALSACDNGPKLEKIIVENAQTMFKIGDEFTYGEDFKVYAVYSDETQVDITNDPDLSIKKENGFDMNVADNYQITVSYKNKIEVYTIYVSDFDPILRKIEADTEGVKKNYELGETISFEGLKLTLTYENAQGQYVTSVVSSLRNFEVVISDEKGGTIAENEAFPALGDYKVTISQGPIKAEFTVVVDGINLSSVQSAIAVVRAYRHEVLSGTLSVQDETQRTLDKPYDVFHKEYTYGDNYLHTKETVEGNEDCYYSMDAEGIFCIKKQDGQIIADSHAPEKAIEGAPIFLWYMSVTEYGIENALYNLYEAAKVCTNNDLDETANEDTREYSFSFSGLVFRSSNADYYETTVRFKLGEKYNIESAEFTQLYYENTSSMPGFTPTFTTDEVTGITTPWKPVKGFTQKQVVKVTQVAGERTETNPYSRDMFRVQSYDLIYDGKVLEDDSVIECSMQNTSLKLSIANVLPTTANFKQDLLYLDYEGNYGQKDANLITCDGFIASNNFGITISVTLKNGGVWKLILTTANTRKTVTFKVTGVAPTSMTAQLLNETTNSFYNASSKTLAINGGVSFYGAVNQYANDAQRAEVTSANAQTATIEEVTVKGVNCFRFSASAAGTYT